MALGQAISAPQRLTQARVADNRVTEALAESFEEQAYGLDARYTKNPKDAFSLEAEV